MRLLLLVALVALAGCSAPEAEPAARVEALSDAPASVAAVAVLAPPGERDAPSLRASVEIPAPWQRPLREVLARGEAPAGARLAWFVARAEAAPRAVVVGERAFVMKATTPDHSHPADEPRHVDDVPVRAPLDVGVLPLDGSPASVRLAQPGRYVLGAGAAQLTVNVWPGAPRDEALQSFLTGERFAPAVVDAPPGARLLLWNAAGSAAPVMERSFAAYLPLAGLEVALTPIDEGLYDLQLVALDDEGARGFARAPFLVDFEKPAEVRAIGPASGRFTQGELAAGERERARFAFDAEEPVRALRLRIEAGSSLPAPASVRVAIEREDQLVADASSAQTDAIELADLPAGRYAIVVTAERGALVGYEVLGELVYDLPEPARLRDAR